MVTLDFAKGANRRLDFGFCFVCKFGGRNGLRLHFEYSEIQTFSLGGMPPDPSTTYFAFVRNSILATAKASI